MPDDIDIDSLRDRFEERRSKLRGFQSDLNATLDYFTRAPETNDEEREQKSGILSDLGKLTGRIRDFSSTLD